MRSHILHTFEIVVHIRKIDNHIRKNVHHFARVRTRTCMSASLHKSRRSRLGVLTMFDVALVGGLVETAPAELALDEAVVNWLYSKCHKHKHSTC